MRRQKTDREKIGASQKPFELETRVRLHSYTRLLILRGYFLVS